MIKHGLVLLGYIFLSAASSAFATPADTLVRELADSVLRVEVKLANGKQGFGSAVVVAKDEVITNCHVVADATAIAVKHNAETHIATLVKPDWRHDLCLLKVVDLNAPIVKMGATESLKYEQSVFTVGYPDGISQPISTYGSVKGMFPLDDSVVMRASSAFRLGASGGGAFDDAGNLIGVITLKSKGSQAYYYYMPVAWVQALMLKPAEALSTKSEKPFWAYAEKPYFMRVVHPYQTGDWDSLIAIAKEWTASEPATAESWFTLATAELATKDYVAAVAHFRKVLSLNKDHPQAATYLAELTDKLAIVSASPSQLALLD
jgi:serine protease Do